MGVVADHQMNLRARHEVVFNGEEHAELTATDGSRRIDIPF